MVHCINDSKSMYIMQINTILDCHWRKFVIDENYALWQTGKRSTWFFFSSLAWFCQLFGLYMYSVWCYHDYLAAVAGPALFCHQTFQKNILSKWSKIWFFSHCSLFFLFIQLRPIFQAIINLRINFFMYI